MDMMPAQSASTMLFCSSWNSAKQSFDTRKIWATPYLTVTGTLSDDKKKKARLLVSAKLMRMGHFASLNYAPAASSSDWNCDYGGHHTVS